MVRAAFLILLLAGCASTPRDPALDAYPMRDTARELREERARDAVQRMTVEFNQVAGES